jgi:UDP-glucuronate decarboxylase
MIETMTILVTAGTSFIGSHLCHYLISIGQQVVCLTLKDSCYTENISDLLTHPKFTLSVYQQNQTPQLTDDITEIYHLLGVNDRFRPEADGLRILTSYFQETRTLLALAPHLKAKFLLANTANIYGNSTHYHISENDYGSTNTIGIRSGFEQGQRVSETLTMEYHRKYQLDTKIARVFNSYGSKMNPDSGDVISNFMIQSLSGEHLTIYGSGLQTRTYCHIDDLIRGITALMSVNYHLPVNLGGSERFSLKQLAKTVGRITGQKTKTKHSLFQLPVDEPTHLIPDISRAKRILDWSPRIKLQDGLAMTLNYFTHCIDKEQGRSSVPKYSINLASK